ncbi:MAG: TIGR01777 family oxidoreductase [Ignavibacteriales bacterium]|nr:TIGR01777 family oxidoreductase [Ignavibacteriales bacterium]
MKIVIAGATGLIGKLLTKTLLNSGHSVVVLTRNAELPTTSSQPLLHFDHWDGKGEGSWHCHIDHADAVVNLAGESLGANRWTKSRKRALISSRVDPTASIVNAMKAATAKPRVFVNASAVGYYGPVEEGDVTEDNQAGDDFTSTLCVEWEQAALGAMAFGVRVVLLRSGIVLDPRGGALQKMLLPFRLFAGGPLGSGDQWLPWIHREDEVRAICFSLENERVSGPVNLASPESVTMRDFCVALGKTLRRPSGLRVPTFVLRALLGEMADIVLTGQRVVPKKLLQEGFKFRFPDLKDALENLFRKNGTLGR